MPSRPIALQKVYEAELFFLGQSFRIYSEDKTAYTAEQTSSHDVDMVMVACFVGSPKDMLTSSRSLKRKTSRWSWDSFCL